MQVKLTQRCYCFSNCFSSKSKVYILYLFSVSHGSFLLQPLIKFIYEIEGYKCQAITSQYKKAASVWYSDLRKVKVVLSI